MEPPRKRANVENGITISPIAEADQEVQSPTIFEGSQPIIDQNDNGESDVQQDGGSHESPSTGATANAPTVILLPCAFLPPGGPSDVKVIGPPQVVIPVAVSQGVRLDPIFQIHQNETLEKMTKSIHLVDAQGETLFQFDFNSNSVSASDSQINTHGTPPVAQNSHSTADGTAESSRVSPQAESSEVKKDEPLDLSGKGKDENLNLPGLKASAGPPVHPLPVFNVAQTLAQIVQPNRLPAPKLSTISSLRPIAPKVFYTIRMPAAVASMAPRPTVLIPKAFECQSCGVRFASEKTLSGHVQYYCKNTRPEKAGSNHDDLKSDSGNKELNCHLCEFVGTSINNLASHHRSMHGDDQGENYFCGLCGYRGFSARGMTNHLRSVHGTTPDVPISEPSQPPPNLLANSNAKVEAKTPPDGHESSQDSDLPEPTLLCEGCQRTFGSMTTYTQHVCTSGLISLAAAAVSSCANGSNQENYGSPGTNGTEKVEWNNLTKAGTTGGKASRSLESAFTVVTDDAGLNRYKCNFCPYVSPHKGNVKRHLTLLHRDELDDPNDSNEDVNVET